MPRRAIALAVAVATGLAPLSSFAQTLDGKGKGLDALDEGQVMARLATDGLTKLLDRDFDVYKVPPDQRQQQQAVIELQQLGNALGLKPADRRARAERIAKGLDPQVDKSNDPAALQRQAFILINVGITPTVTELEYFGENPAAQAQLNAVVTTVKHMLQRAADLSGAQIKVLVAKISGNGSNIVQLRPQINALKPLRDNSAFADQMTTYALCLSLPKGDAQRAQAADKAIEFFKRFDTDKSGIQAGIRLQTGKLQLVKGDFAAAKATLGALYAGAATDVKPPAKPKELNDARYFAAVADLLAGKPDDAETDAKSLDQWQATGYLPTLQPEEQDPVKAASAMLSFRIASARADAAADPARKQQFNDQAITILSNLLQQNPDPALRNLVFDQLVTRIPANPDVKRLDALALQALQQQGFDEYNKKDDASVDKAALERGIAAAREIGTRAGQPGVNADLAANADYFVAYALETKLHDDAGAAGAFMDFTERYPKDTERATDALQHAGRLVFGLHKAAVAKNAPDPVEVKLYDRFLPLAINPPYNQKQVALDYADLLKSQGKQLEAVKYYGLVAKDEKHYPDAQVGKMLSLFAALGDGNLKLPADQKKSLADDLQRTAADVEQAATAAGASATDDAGKRRQQLIAATARYDAATSARRDLKDPAKTLQWLDGMEDKVKGLDNGPQFVQSTLTQRVQAYMALGKTADATNTLVQLLAANAEQGEGMLFDLIQQITHDLDVAKGNNDLPAQRELATNKATLSGFLVTYAQGSKDPAVQKQLPAYKLYDADSKRQAAELTEDPAAKQANLEAALKQYQSLDAAGNTDPLVRLGTGLTQFDLGHYADTIAALAPVLTKVGQPMIEVNGQRVANPQYWETYYKQLRSMFEVAKANPNDAKSKEYLTTVKQRVGAFFVLYGDQTGGPGYHDDFVKLRDDAGVPATTNAPKA